MKKILVLLTCAAAVSAYSQGTVAFSTRDTINGVNALIQYTNSSVAGPVANGIKPGAGTNITSATYPGSWGGNNARAGLYGGANGTAADQLVLLVPAVGFRTGAAAGYVDPGSDATRVVNGVAGGALATFQVRAWDVGTSAPGSYEAAKALGVPGYFGVSQPLNNITLGNFIPPGGTPTPSAALTGLQGFGMDFVVPEPSIIGLGILGAVAGLLVFRRRN